MNPLYRLAASLMTTLSLTRKCPRCGAVRVVPRGEQDRTLSCGSCGADLPPPPRR